MVLVTSDTAEQRKGSAVRSISSREWALLAIILVYSSVPSIGGLARVFELLGGPAVMPANPRALADPLPVVLHGLSSSLFCLVGALQFLPSLRRDFPATHALVGRVIASAGCVSALTGLWMTHVFAFPTELQGSLLYGVRIALSLSMVGLIVRAVVAIRSRDVRAHSASMLRAYAIGQGASTQAVVGIGWIILVGSEPHGPLRDAMMVLSWGLNLLIAELLISRAFALRTRPT